MFGSFRFPSSQFILIILSANAFELCALEFDISTSAKLSYSDNIDLNSEKISDLISTLSVGASLVLDRETTDLLFEYNIYRTNYFKGNRDDDYYNELVFTMNKSLMNNQIVLNADVDVSNVSDSFIDESNSDIIYGNTVENRVINTGVSYRNNSSDHLEFSVGLNGNLTSNEDNIGNFSRLAGDLLLKNNDSTSRFLWSTSSNYQRTFYADSDREYYSYNIEQRIGYEFNNNIDAYMRFYYDEVDQDNLREKYLGWGPVLKYNLNKDSYFELGYEFSPYEESTFNGSFVLNFTPRTGIQFDFNRKSYGDDFSFLFKHRNKKWLNTFTYKEEITDFDREFFIDNTVIESYQLQKSFNLSSTFNLKKSSFYMDAGLIERSPLVVDELLKVKTYRNEIGFNYQLSKHLSFTNSFEYRQDLSNFRTQENQKNRYRIYKMMLKNRFSKSIYADISLSHRNNTSYSENAMTLNVDLNF